MRRDWNVGVSNVDKRLLFAPLGHVGCSSTVVVSLWFMSVCIYIIYILYILFMFVYNLVDAYRVAISLKAAM